MMPAFVLQRPGDLLGGLPLLRCRLALAQSRELRS